MNTITAVQPVRFIVLDDPLYTFNEYIYYRCHHGQPINGGRERFYQFAVPLRKADTRWPLDVWEAVWDEFIDWGRDAMIAAEDARDEAATRADTLV